LDDFLFDNPDMLGSHFNSDVVWCCFDVVNKLLVIVSAGNCGYHHKSTSCANKGESSILSPGRAKNSLSSLN